MIITILETLIGSFSSQSLKHTARKKILHYFLQCCVSLKLFKNSVKILIMREICILTNVYIFAIWKCCIFLTLYNTTNITAIHKKLLLFNFVVIICRNSKESLWKNAPNTDRFHPSCNMEKIIRSILTLILLLIRSFVRLNLYIWMNFNPTV